MRNQAAVCGKKTLKVYLIPVSYILTNLTLALCSIMAQTQTIAIHFKMVKYLPEQLH